MKIRTLQYTHEETRINANYLFAFDNYFHCHVENNKIKMNN